VPAIGASRPPAEATSPCLVARQSYQERILGIELGTGPRFFGTSADSTIGWRRLTSRAVVVEGVRKNLLRPRLSRV